MALTNFKRYINLPHVRVRASEPVAATSFSLGRYLFFAYDENDAPTAIGWTDQTPGDADFERDLQTFHDLLALSYQP
jgi:hypothetical protein